LITQGRHIGDATLVRWQRLIAAHFPIHSDGDFWRYNVVKGIGDLPSQGWKIHVSADVISAPDILQAVVGCISGQNILCKTLHDPAELRRLNSGLYLGYSQIGKFVTLYPPNDEECVRTAHQIARVTAGMPGPMVPFERRVRTGSPVFVRYGLFKSSIAGEFSTQLTTPDGGREEDHRDTNPQWAAAPTGLIETSDDEHAGPLGSRYVAYSAISQRGKGGVYLALDFNKGQLRKCVLKEGRRSGETDLSGEDGFSRIDDERATLIALRSCGVDVPKVYDFFQQGEHRYLVIEHIQGQLLSEVIKDGLGPSAIQCPKQLCILASKLLADIHAAGYVWRDLKVTNLILTPNGRLRPIDFEGSMLGGSQIKSLWGSPGYVPGEWANSKTASFEHDLFSLGVLLKQLYARYEAEVPSSTPQEVHECISQLTSDDPQARPPAATVASILSRSRHFTE
jgi:hypothetical protein